MRMGTKILAGLLLVLILAGPAAAQVGPVPADAGLVVLVVEGEGRVGQLSVARRGAGGSQAVYTTGLHPPTLRQFQVAPGRYAIVVGNGAAQGLLDVAKGRAAVIRTRVAPDGSGYAGINVATGITTEGLRERELERFVERHKVTPLATNPVPLQELGDDLIFRILP